MCFHSFVWAIALPSLWYCNPLQYESLKRLWKALWKEDWWEDVWDVLAFGVQPAVQAEAPEGAILYHDPESSSLKR